MQYIVDQITNKVGEKLKTSLFTSPPMGGF